MERGFTRKNNVNPLVLRVIAGLTRNPHAWAAENRRECNPLPCGEGLGERSNLELGTLNLEF